MVLSLIHETLQQNLHIQQLIFIQTDVRGKAAYSNADLVLQPLTITSFLFAVSSL